MKEEEEKELLGFQPHIRTIMEDIEIGVQEKVCRYIVFSNSFFQKINSKGSTSGGKYRSRDMTIADAV